MVNGRGNKSSAVLDWDTYVTAGLEHGVGHNKGDKEMNMSF